MKDKQPSIAKSLAHRACLGLLPSQTGEPSRPVGKNISPARVKKPSEQGRAHTGLAAYKDQRCSGQVTGKGKKLVELHAHSKIQVAMMR